MLRAEGDLLARLRGATDGAIGAVEARGRPSGGVNWGDLGCVQAALVVTDGGAAYFEVTVEEASPEAGEFQEAIRLELEAAGWVGVRVVTAW